MKEVFLLSRNMYVYIRSDNMTIRNWLFWSGIGIIIVGVIVGFALGQSQTSVILETLGQTIEEKTFLWPVALMWWFGGLVGGGVLLGLSQIIDNQTEYIEEQRRSRSV